MITQLKKDIDYAYSFPYGHHASPQIKVLSGKYSGLVFDIECSTVVSSAIDNKFNVTYKILKFCKNKNKFNITAEDNTFICHAAYNFIRDFNSDLAKGH